MNVQCQSPQCTLGTSIHCKGKSVPLLCEVNVVIPCWPRLLQVKLQESQLYDMVLVADETEHDALDAGSIRLRKPRRIECRSLEDAPTSGCYSVAVLVRQMFAFCSRCKQSNNPTISSDSNVDCHRYGEGEAGLTTDIFKLT